MVGDCWIGLSLAKDSGLILAARVGKHTDAFLEELVASTEGKTDCQQWHTDGWFGYERVLTAEIDHQEGTQRLERTNGIQRPHTVRWHRLGEQICQALGTDESDGQVNRQLFQLALRE